MELQVHAGKVQYVGRSHGFLEWQLNSEAQPRIMFNAFDVEGNLTLCVGDEVTFTVADKVCQPALYVIYHAVMHTALSWSR